MVTLGMVAAISGVGGLMAANPPSWATAAEPAVASAETTTAQTAQGPDVDQAAWRASEEAARQEAAAREATARAEAAREEPERAAQQESAVQAGANQAAAEQAAAEQYAAEQAAAQPAAEQAALAQQQAAFSAQPQGNVGAVSQGS